MATRTLPGLGLTGFWPLGDNNWKAAMDANLRIMSALVNGAVKSRTTALPGTPTLGDIYIVPSGGDANKIAIWDGEVGAEAWVYLTPKAGWHTYVIDDDENVQWSGTSWGVFAGAGGGGGVYDIRLGFTTPPTTAEVLDTILLPREVTFPAAFAGSVGLIGTNPTASFVITVKDDGVDIGTITISTGGVFTFATTSGTAKVVSAGSVLTFVAPVTVDATAANAVITLAGAL